MFVQLFSLSGQPDAPVGAYKKAAAQLFFQIVHGTGNIGLAVHQNVSCSGETAVSGHIIENSVIIIGNIHVSSPPLRPVSHRK